jgi:hypothetical protein
MLLLLFFGFVVCLNKRVRLAVVESGMPDLFVPFVTPARPSTKPIIEIDSISIKAI